MPSKTRRVQQKALAAGEPLIVYVASSLDGTTFALDGVGRLQVGERFPNERVPIRRVFISHETQTSFGESVGHFTDPVVVLLTGVRAKELVKAFGAISFREPQTGSEVARLSSTA